MKIDLQRIKIRDLVNGFENNEEEGVTGYSGRLNIRPKYQREFVYNEKERQAVIDTVFNDYPLNVMYWVSNETGGYELLDGQQRTLSICSYYMGEFFINLNGKLKAYNNLTVDERERFLNYKLMVYLCTDGTDSEKLDWFDIINIAGKALTEQERRNAIFCGEWVTDAKKKFSKTNCLAYKIGKDYLNGTSIRQDYLETAIRWISETELKNVTDGKERIEKYMALHQHDANALALWQYFQSVITWVEGVCGIKHKKIMKGTEWGLLYNQYKDNIYDAKLIEQEASRLLMDDEVDSKKGIYPYIFTRKEKFLNLRTFSDAQKLSAYERQKGICPMCGNRFDIEEMEADHITPWHAGGKTVPGNCQMLCRECNRRKSGK